MFCGGCEVYMTINEGLKWVEYYNLELAAYFASIPLLTLILRLLHGKKGGEKAPFRYAYGLLVYLVSIPGMFSATLCLYSLFFTRTSLLDQSLTLYLLPPISMFVSLMLMNKFVSFDAIAGFDRITGLMTLLGVAFFVLFLLSRLRLWVVFVGSIQGLIAIGVFLFVLLKWGSGRVFRAPEEPKEEFPRFLE
jgi:hypothetical protein